MIKDIEFIKESNAIERIYRDPTDNEIKEYNRFMALSEITIQDLQKFVLIYAGAKAVFRDKENLNVKIGKYYPPRGGEKLVRDLQKILTHTNKIKRSHIWRKYDFENLLQPVNIKKEAYKIHVKYEKLHPFMDGNGRSGRMIWKWLVKDTTYSFLQSWYYQSLSVI